MADHASDREGQPGKESLIAPPQCHKMSLYMLGGMHAKQEEARNPIQKCGSAP